MGDDDLIRAFQGSVIVVSVDEHFYTHLSDEVIILNLLNSRYYGLRSVGARVWDLIQQPQTVSKIVAAISEEYEVAAEICAHDISALLQELAAAGLIRVLGCSTECS